jgi:DNA modification methylase
MEGHPAVSPDELARRIVKMYSFTGETVLDPFLGSGTTLKVAQELGRSAIGYGVKRNTGNSLSKR